MSIQGMSGGDMRHRIMQRLDANGDGALDRGELQKFADVLSEHTGRDIGVDTLLDRTDANKDGMVSPDEMVRPAGGPMGAMAQMMSGGAFDPQELMARIDTDGNGQVSPEEREQARETMRQELQAKLQSLRMQRR